MIFLTHRETNKFNFKQFQMKNKISKLYLVSALIIAIAGECQNFHGVIFANTDANIGRAIQKNADNVLQLYKGIAANLNYNFISHEFAGTRFSYENLDSFLTNFRVNDGDVIFFYISSHGFKSSNNNPFPRILMINDKKIKKRLYRCSAINERLIANNRNSGSVVTIFQACNRTVSGTSDIDISDASQLLSPENFVKNYQKLFTNKENLMIASSQRGKTSSNTPSLGSHFTRAFVTTFPGYMQNNRPDAINWQNLMQQVKITYIKIQKEFRTRKKDRRNPVFQVNHL